MEPKERKILGITFVSHSLVHLFEGVLPPLIPLVMLEMGTDYFHIGLVVTLFSYAFGFGSLPAGLLADRIGARRLVTFYLFGAGMLSILIWPARTLWAYAILMGLVGLCCSTYHPAANTLLSLSIRDKGRAFGIHGIAGSLGVAAVPLLSAWLGTKLGWRWPHVLFGLLGILTGLLSLTITEQRPQKSVSQDGRTPSGDTVVIFWPAIIIFFASATALGLTYKGVMTFLPVYMGANVHISGLNAGAVLTGGGVATTALICGALGQYWAGRMVDRHGAEMLYLVAILIGMACVFSMALTTGWLLVVLAMVYAFFFFATQPIQNYLISGYLPAHRHGMGYGIHFCLTFGIGSAAAAVSGYLADRFGLQSVFVAMGLCFVMAAVASTLLVISSKRRRLALGRPR